MSDLAGLGVVVTPSPSEIKLRYDIIQRAIALGWIVLPAELSDPLAPFPHHEAIVMVAPGGSLEDVPPWEKWIVLADRPSTRINDLLANSTVPGEHRNWWHPLSIRFAAAAQIARAGGSIISLETTTFTLPGLGSFEIDVATPGQEFGESHCLTVYDALPVPIGAESFWPPEIFNYPVGNAVNGGGPSIDLTGRLRGLIAGPHITLTPGVWDCEITMQADPERGRAYLRFEWGAGDDFTHSSVTVEKAGVYSLTLRRAWTSAQYAEARCFVSQPHFQGRIHFLGCRVRKTEDIATSENEPAPLSTSPN